MTIAYVAIIYVVMTAAGLVLSYLIESDYSARQHFVLNSHAQLVKQVVEDTYKSGEQSVNADAICRELSGKINARVQLIGVGGRIVGDSKPGSMPNDPLEGRAERLRSPTCRVCHPEARTNATVMATQHIITPEEVISEARISTPIFGVKQASARTRRIIFSALVIAALIAAALSQRLAFTIAKPITDMSAAAKRIAEGNFEQRVEVESQDEIGQLAMSFNSMAGKLEMMLNQMAEDKDKMETILTTMADGIIVTDESGRIALFNKSSENVLGIHAGEAEGRLIDELGLQPELTSMVRDTLKTRRMVRKDIKLTGPPEVTLNAYSLPVRDTASDVKGAVIVLHDLTEVRRHEQAQKEFVANVSHELRTPITAVRVTAEALLSGAKNDPKLLDRFLTTLVTESERLSLLIDDLLEIAKREAGRRKLKRSEVDVHEVAERVIALHRAEAERNHQDLIMNVPDVVVFADERQIEQILANLLDNAVKYTPAGGRIAVSAEEDEKSVSISVSDTGIGIPQADVSRIFERFYRVDKARSRQRGGTGLGLSIVKDIVEAHGGSITVQTNLDQGSTFTVSIPHPRGADEHDAPSKTVESA